MPVRTLAARASTGGKSGDFQCARPSHRHRGTQGGRGQCQGANGQRSCGTFLAGSLEGRNDQLAESEESTGRRENYRQRRRKRPLLSEEHREEIMGHRGNSQTQRCGD